jgi:hypothetical protein
MMKLSNHLIMTGINHVIIIIIKLKLKLKLIKVNMGHIHHYNASDNLFAPKYSNKAICSKCATGRKIAHLIYCQFVIWQCDKS